MNPCAECKHTVECTRYAWLRVLRRYTTDVCPMIPAGRRVNDPLVTPIADGLLAERTDIQSDAAEEFVRLIGQRSKRTRVLANFKNIIFQVTALEEKQAKARETIQELKRSLFHQLGGELNEEGTDLHDERRFEFFELAVLAILGKPRFTMEDLGRYQEIPNLLGLEHKQAMKRWQAAKRLRRVHCNGLDDRRFPWEILSKEQG